MKSLVFASLLALSATVQAEVLYSKDARNSICSEASYELEDRFRLNSFDGKSCMAGDFEVTRKLTDNETGELTVMQVKYSFTQPKMQVSGEAEVVRIFRVDASGQIKKTWATRSIKLKVDDQRAYADLINELFDETNFGNGYGEVVSRPVSFSVAQMEAELEEALPNEEDSSCVYATTTSTSWALSDLRYQDQTTYDFLKELKKQGKIKAAVSRVYDDGESEYCSHYYYRILLEDGTYVILDLDFTT